MLSAFREAGCQIQCHWRASAAGIAVCGFLFFLPQAVRVAAQDAYRMRVNVGASLLDERKMIAGLRQRVDAGDAAAQSELLHAKQRLAAKLRMLQRGWDMDVWVVGGLRLSPLLLVDSVVWMATIVLLGFCYLWFSLILCGEALLPSAFGAIRSLWKLLALAAALLLATFLWVPLLLIVLVGAFDVRVDALIMALVCAGYLLSLLLGPRLAMSPFFLFQGDSLRVALRRSYLTTSGRWSVMLGTITTMVSGSLLVYLLGIFLLAFLPAHYPLAGLFLQSLLIMAEFAFLSLFSRIGMEMVALSSAHDPPVITPTSAEAGLPMPPLPAIAIS